eukprot:CAMPEP_0202972624 /NCGR_PEP_ID=MMETSP1396-20130829/38226_1 /ASSEMBLY_ACC=CAM_ASM_000872 /TAXON_ID= /ORGANISM="Pseudokeronopsis sp., Strain Brazil" /LENGTH=54 /DNA_ID=CAMNT_0049703243 /DNA_START=208 /DNA_END=369 /DNA_ORIENTATION=+
MSLEVICQESLSKIKYELKIDFFAPIDTALSKHEYQTVGKHHFTLKKLNAPARW